MPAQLSLLANLYDDPPVNPLANQIWLEAAALGFDGDRFKRFVVAGFQVERYDRERYLRATDESLLPLRRRLALIATAHARRFPNADERQFWNLVSSLKVPHDHARPLIQYWSFDGQTDWPGAVEELLTLYGWATEQLKAA